MTGSVLFRFFRNRYVPPTMSHYTSRRMSTKPPQRTQPKSLNHMPLKRSWLTRKVEESPMWRALFFKFTDIVGYGSPKQMAGRHSFVLYDKVCAVKPDEDREFWQDGELFYVEYFVRTRSYLVSLSHCGDCCSTSTRVELFSYFLLTRILSVFSSSNISILVYRHKSSYLDANRASTGSPCGAWKSLPTGSHRPLLHRHRRSHPYCPPTPFRTLSTIHI